MNKSIVDGYTNGLKSIVMSSASTQDELRSAIINIGVRIGQQIIEDYFMTLSSFITPMNIEVKRLIPKVPLCMIVTTKDDFCFIGKGISNVFTNSINGYMDFEGKRGIQALNSEIMHMVLPDPKGQIVDTLIIAKAVLATGCTAIHLAKRAFDKYFPRRIIVASIFYSEQGVSELVHEIPNADIIVVGAPDTLNDEGMLVPGVGNLDQRLSASPPDYELEGAVQ